VTPEERAVIRRQAAARARAMGLKSTSAEAPAAAVDLPTHNPTVLRQLLHRGHLTPEQGQVVRWMFAEAARINAQHNDDQGDQA
jgi:hypothetical protein